MILKTFDKKGRLIYVNAFTGRRVKLRLVRPGKTGRLPDYVFRFLKQSESRKKETNIQFRI